MRRRSQTDPENLAQERKGNGDEAQMIPDVVTAQLEITSTRVWEHTSTESMWGMLNTC